MFHSTDASDQASNHKNHRLDGIGVPPVLGLFLELGSMELER